jgi:hypothetical protein
MTEYSVYKDYINATGCLNTIVGTERILEGPDRDIFAVISRHLAGWTEMHHKIMSG